MATMVVSLQERDASQSDSLGSRERQLPRGATNLEALLPVTTAETTFGACRHSSSRSSPLVVCRRTAMMVILSAMLLLVPTLHAHEHNNTWHHCGCMLCTDSVWETIVHVADDDKNGDPNTIATTTTTTTCGALIQKQHAESAPDSVREHACVSVAMDHAECAPCNYLACTAEASTAEPAPRYCACPGCADASTGEDEKTTCANRLDALLKGNALLSEPEACAVVVEALPDSCGRYCDPLQCQHHDDTDAQASGPAGNDNLGTILPSNNNTDDNDDDDDDDDRAGSLLGWVFTGVTILMLAVLLLALHRFKKRQSDSTREKTSEQLEDSTSLA